MASMPGFGDAPSCGDPSRNLLDDAFTQFLNFKADKSDATHRAYRSDYDGIRHAIADHTGVPAGELTLSDALPKEVLWTCFGARFRGKPASSRKRCWSTWNSLCDFLVDQELILSNPMRHLSKGGAGTPPAPPKAIEAPDVNRLLTQLAMPNPDDPHTWRDRDLALILSGLLLGLRTGDMISLDIGDFTPRHDEPGAMTISILGKGSKYRVLTSEPELTQILEGYLASRAQRFPDTVPPARRTERNLWKRFAPDQPLFVGSDGQRITRGTIQYRVKRAYSRAGIVPSPGASTHRLRHTFAIQLAESGVPVHTLMSLLGHSALSSTQKYLEASGVATRDAARSNPLYKSLPRSPET